MRLVVIHTSSLHDFYDESGLRIPHDASRNLTFGVVFDPGSSISVQCRNGVSNPTCGIYSAIGYLSSVE
jgi:hypothetical protein